MKRSIQTTLTGRPSRLSLFLDHRRWGLETKVFVVRLSTRSAELACDLAPLLSEMVPERMVESSRQYCSRLGSTRKKALL